MVEGNISEARTAQVSFERTQHRQQHKQLPGCAGLKVLANLKQQWRCLMQTLAAAITVAKLFSRVECDDPVHLNMRRA